MTTAERIRAFRKRHKLSARAAAERLGTTHTTVLTIERGGAVSPNLARRIAPGLGVRSWHKLVTETQP